MSEFNMAVEPMVTARQLHDMIKEAFPECKGVVVNTSLQYTDEGELLICYSGTALNCFGRWEESSEIAYATGYTHEEVITNMERKAKNKAAGIPETVEWGF